MIRRKRPLTRSPKPLQKAKPKAVNRKRKAREFQRAYGGEERVHWMQARPCVACGSKPSENAHVGAGGIGRKGDAATVVPLCASCHKVLHPCAAETEAAWAARSGLG